MGTSNCESCSSKTCSAKEKQNHETTEEFMERQELTQKMCAIKHKILVLSGKGGVGKSTVAANIATALSRSGNKVGILDIDIHGPSIPTLFGIENATLRPGEKKDSMLPIEITENLKAMSIGFLLQHRDDALIWRGPMKIGVIKQFLKDVEWGDLDYLIADLPPGTGDEPLSMCQMIEGLDGAVVVTTPQEMALADVRKSINFCKKLNLPILGVVENMSGFRCPKCGDVTDIFKKGGAEEMCKEMDVPFIGRIPITPEIVIGADSGNVVDIDETVSSLFDEIVDSVTKTISE